MKLITTFVTEIIKLRRSKIFAITLVFFIFIPLMLGLLMYLAKHPEMASKMGLAGAKASLFAENNWNSFFNILNQSMAVIGLIGFGFITSWVFGREYMDRTIKDLLALPVSRTYIVTAKFILIILWCGLLSFIMLFSAIALGQWIGMTGWEDFNHTQQINRYLATALYSILLITPVAFIASYGRGIIAAIAFIIATVIMAQFVTFMGIGAYFPWAIPGINTIPPGTAGMELLTVSYIILILTSLAGLAGTVLWWQKADQH